MDSLPPVSNEFHVVRNRPMPKEPLSFYNFKNGNRLFITVADSVKTWRDDLIIGERLFADTVICPLGDVSEHEAAVSQTKDILKQRMKYPGVKENPELEQLAKTWVLPTKLHLGPQVSSFLDMDEKAVFNVMDGIFKQTSTDDSIVHFLKVELQNGIERQLLYKILDGGFRPSLMLVKWSYDLDDHIPTAHCAGHLLNSGYSLVCLENGYALYFYVDQPLYDITSMKQISISNPIMNSILQTVSENLVKGSVVDASETSSPSVSASSEN